MIFDSVYDIYRGVVTYVRVVDGRITAMLDDLEFLASNEGGQLVKIDRAGRKDIRLLPPAEYVEAKGQCTRATSAPVKRQRGRQQKAKM